MTEKKPSNKEYEELGRQLVNFYETGFSTKKHALWFTFLKGLVGGLGTFLGGTIIIALLLWILNALSILPFIPELRSLLER